MLYYPHFTTFRKGNFRILLILWCSFKLWWNVCLDLSRSKFCSLGNRSIKCLSNLFTITYDSKLFILFLSDCKKFPSENSNYTDFTVILEKKNTPTFFVGIRYSTRNMVKLTAMTSWQLVSEVKVFTSLTFRNFLNTLTLYIYIYYSAY